jgi:hypothetical protein
MSAKTPTAALLPRLGAALSMTILSFSSSDQRLRRPVSTTSSRSIWALHPKDSSQQHASFGKAAFTGRIRLLVATVRTGRRPNPDRSKYQVKCPIFPIEPLAGQLPPYSAKEANVVDPLWVSVHMPSGLLWRWPP